MSPAPLPPPPPEVPVDCSLTGLAPGFRARLTDMLDAFRRDGFDATIAETLRTDARQRFLYGFGREYDDGRGIVTHSQDADETWHHFGLAADVVHATLEWNAPRTFWDALGWHALNARLTWGGDWRHPDLPHVQFGAPMRDSPSPRAARLLASGGMEAVWREVGAA